MTSKRRQGLKRIQNSEPKRNQPKAAQPPTHQQLTFLADIAELAGRDDVAEWLRNYRDYPQYVAEEIRHRDAKQSEIAAKGQYVKSAKGKWHLPDCDFVRGAGDPQAWQGSNEIPDGDERCGICLYKSPEQVAADLQALGNFVRKRLNEHGKSMQGTWHTLSCYHVQTTTRTNRWEGSNALSPGDKTHSCVKARLDDSAAPATAA